MPYPSKSGGFGDKKRGGFGGGRPSFGGGRPSFGGGRPSFGRDRNDGPREMFRSTCAECHRPCEVPFRPSMDKPVYCSDCFASKREDSDDRGGRRDDRRESRRDDRSGRESFSRKEFSPAFASKSAGREDKRIEELKRQLETVNAKVDTILKIVSGRTLVVETPEKQPKKEVDKVAVKESLKNMMADAQKSEKKSAKKIEKKSLKKEEKKAEKKVTKKKAISKKK